MSQVQIEKLYNRAQVAEMIGVSQDTLKKWSRAKIGPPELKINGAVRFDPIELAKWIQSRTRTN